jgi:hypothetical protein
MLFKNSILNAKLDSVLGLHIWNTSYDNSEGAQRSLCPFRHYFDYDGNSVASFLNVTNSKSPQGICR